MSGPIVGIDPSLTATGVCVLTPHRTPRLRTVGSTGTRTDTWQRRGHRMRDLRDRIMATIPNDTTLACIEGPAYNAQTPSNWDRAHLWWLLHDALTWMRVPTAVIPPATRAKFATDKGNADKTAVAIAAARMWPGTTISDNNQADALILATTGAVKLRTPVPFTVLERHRLALSKIVWPTQ
jgi:Holliday junction resolvasome RuvABC endonuclease subunit